MQINGSRIRVAGFLLVGVLFGALVINPVAAHVTTRFGHLWNDHIEPRLSAPGTVNAPGNPVSWTKLKDVPEGFVDGTDAGQPGGTTRRTWVIPHILERAGRASSEPNTTDVIVSAVCRRGIVAACEPNMRLEIYLFDDQGEPTRAGDSTGTAVAVCNPCTFPLGGNVRKQSVRIDDLITANGGAFDNTVKLGFAIITVTGADVDAVSIQGFVVNSHTNQFDLTISPMELQEDISSG